MSAIRSRPRIASTSFIRCAGAKKCSPRKRPGARTTLGLPGRLVVETKGGASPSPLDRALWWAGVQPSRVSKYGAGLAALTDLPDLKWHRVVNQHLRPEHPA